MTTNTVTIDVVGRVVVGHARDAVSRAVRQALQALVPTLLVIAGGSSISGIDLPAVLGLAGVTAFVSILKSVAGFKLPLGAPVGWQVAERAAVAAAGAALGLSTVGLDGSVSVAWEGLLTASVGSAVLAVVMFYTNPPVVQGEVVGSSVDATPTAPANEPLPEPVPTISTEGKPWNSGVDEWSDSTDDGPGTEPSKL